MPGRVVGAMAAPPAVHVFPFAFDAPFALPGRLFGVHPLRAAVELDEHELRARFGRWRLATPRSNIRGAGITGPYAVHRTIGPAHLSLRDRGLTFATNARLGVCMRFDEPVPGIEPTGWLRHPGLTVTVADPEALVRELRRSGTVRTDVEDRRDLHVARDELHAMATSELRREATGRGIDGARSASRDELVEVLDAEVPELQPVLLDHRSPER